MVRYIPTIYVDEDGETHSKEKIKQKLYKKLKTTTYAEKANGNVYIHTINLIRITEQKNLF